MHHFLNFVKETKILHECTFCPLFTYFSPVFSDNIGSLRNHPSRWLKTILQCILRILFTCRKYKMCTKKTVIYFWTWQVRYIGTTADHKTPAWICHWRPQVLHSQSFYVKVNGSFWLKAGLFKIHKQAFQTSLQQGYLRSLLESCLAFSAIN